MSDPGNAPAPATAAAAPPESADEAGISRMQGVFGRLVLLGVAILLIGQIVVAWFALSGFERELEPELGRKADVVGRSVANRLHYVIHELDIPARELVGMDGFFDNVLNQNPDIEYLIMTNEGSDVLFSRGLTPAQLSEVVNGLRRAQVPGAAAVGAGEGVELAAGLINDSFPVTENNAVTAVLHVGTSSEYARSRLSEILYEVITVILVSLLVVVEFLMFFMNVRLFEPLERLQRVLEEGSRGIFTNRLVNRAQDEIGRISAAFNRIIQNMSQHYEDFAFEVSEIEGSQINEGISAKIRGAYRRVADHYHFTGGRDLPPQSPMQIRLPLFLFIFSEELSRSFLPLFIARMSPQESPISGEMLIGLPITLFMLAAAIATPLGGGLADRLGARKVFLIGIVPAVIGYFGSFFVQTYYDLVLWRTLTGIGYGLIFIAAQAWVAQNAGGRGRAQGAAIFVGAVFTGNICGPSIGGIFAERIGFEAVFLISAGLALFSGFIVYKIFDYKRAQDEEAAKKKAAEEQEEGAAGPAAPGTFAALRMLFSDARFLAISLCAAAPGKLILVGFLFYLSPLYLSELGNRQSYIGWFMMLYGVACLALTPFVARLADRFGQHVSTVTAGGVVAALGCFAGLAPNAFGGPTTAVVIAIIALGIGHALSLSSQLALIQQVAERYRDALGQASVIGAYRMVERAGLVLGPIVAGTLALQFGYRGAIIGIGFLVLVLIIAYAVVMAMTSEESSPMESRTAA